MVASRCRTRRELSLPLQRAGCEFQNFRECEFSQRTSGRFCIWFFLSREQAMSTNTEQIAYKKRENVEQRSDSCTFTSKTGRQRGRVGRTHQRRAPQLPTRLGGVSFTTNHARPLDKLFAQINERGGRREAGHLCFLDGRGGGHGVWDTGGEKKYESDKMRR